MLYQIYFFATYQREGPCLDVLCIIWLVSGVENTDMDNIILQKLPKEIVDTLDRFFVEGKYVNDFKIIGNSKGFSITLHLCNQPCPDLDHWSPGIISKSPSTCKHDLERRLRWERAILESPTPANMKDKPKRPMTNRAISCDLGSNAESQNVNIAVLNEMKDENENIDLVQQETDKDISHNSGIKADEDSKTADVTLFQNVSCENENIEIDSQSDLFQDDSKVEHDIKSHDNDYEASDTLFNSDYSCKTSESCEDEYSKNIQNYKRNTIFNKIVHDTRDGHSKVYGLTDDLIVSVDEEKKRFESWAIYDKEEVRQCKEIYELLQRWPHAKTKNCKYGVDSLHAVLPDIVKSEREIYADKDNVMP